MNSNYLDFEQPIAELQAKIDELKNVGSDNAMNLDEEIQRLQSKMRTKIKAIFKDLTPWQISQLSRHPLRPYTLDYVDKIFDEFHELHGDRSFADDHAIVGGLARFRGRSVVFIGQQKGRDTKAKIFRNFGMPRPEGYRKVDATDEPGRPLSPALADVYRHTGRLSRGRRRGARAIRGDSPQPAAHVAPSRAHHMHGHW